MRNKTKGLDGKTQKNTNNSTPPIVIDTGYDSSKESTTAVCGSARKYLQRHNTTEEKIESPTPTTTTLNTTSAEPLKIKKHNIRCTIL